MRDSVRSAAGSDGSCGEDSHDAAPRPFYTSAAVISDCSPRSGSERDPESHYRPSVPGARLPHVRGGGAAHTCFAHDLADADRFTPITGIAGAAWANGLTEAGERLGVPVRPVVIAPAASARTCT